MKSDDVKRELAKRASPEKAKVLQGFFKTGKGEYGEGDVFIGVVVPDIRAVVKISSDISLVECMRLLQSRIHEHRLAALLILVKKFDGGDEKTRERILNVYLKNTARVNNWDLVDLSAPNIVGKWLLANPSKLGLLDKLANSKSLWERRIAMVATFAFIYNKDPKPAIKIATRLLRDKHDLIQKAVGWMLREVGKRCDEKTLRDFLDKNARTMPRTALRYSIERLDEKSRKAYLSKGRS